MAEGRWMYWALGVLGVTAAVAGGMAYVRFRRDMRSARARLDALDRRMVDTAMGPVEIGTWGEGEIPVLSVHGIMGGFDQGLMLTEGWLDPAEYRVIAPSRFGYLGTAMPDRNPRPADQADTFAALLDALEIDRIGVVATSAGGTSALQFALRHPDRCAGLVLVSSNAPSDTPFTAPPRPVIEAVFGSDFLFWMLTTHFRKQLHPVLGVPKGYDLNPEDRVEVENVVETLLPVSDRTTGAIHDFYVSNPAINDGVPLESIPVPALVIGAVDDPLAAYEDIEAMARRIPNARLLTVAEGGHMLLGDDGRVPAEIQAFLRDTASRVTLESGSRVNRE